MTSIGKVCNGLSQEHRDAEKLVQWLFDRSGSTRDPNNELAAKLYSLKHGQPDMSRFYRARNHARDRVDPFAAPCCGYRLHYRGRVAGTSTLELIDPTAALANRARSAIQSMRGWTMRERQHHTENERQSVTFNAIGDECVAAGDTYGARINYQAANEVTSLGTLTPPTLAAYMAWLETIPT